MRMGRMLALGAAMMLCGCASVSRGTDEPVTFDSEPPGAEMRSQIVNVCHEEGSCARDSDDRYQSNIDREHKPGPSCVTPCTIQVKRADQLIVTFSKEGYHPQTVRLGIQPSGGGSAGFAGNIILGGAVGMVTDSVTHAAYDHTPNPLKVVLVPVKPAAPAARRRR